MIGCLSFGVGAEGGVGKESPEVLELAKTYSWLEHCRLVLTINQVIALYFSNGGKTSLLYVVETLSPIFFLKIT